MAITVDDLQVIIRLKDELTPALSGITKSIARAVAGMITVGAVVKVATDALKAQADQEAAINKLNLALSNQGRLTPALSKSLIDYSAALQDVSTYADEVVLSGEATLVKFGLNEAQIKRTSKAALDFAAFTGGDVVSAFDLLGKASTGNVAMLQRQGFQFDENASKSEKFESALSQIEKTMGGAALAATQTYTGAMKQLENTTGDAKESLGLFLGELGGGTRPFGLLNDAARLAGEVFKSLVIIVSWARAAILLEISAIVLVIDGMLIFLSKIPGPFRDAFAKAATALGLFGDSLKVNIHDTLDSAKATVEAGGHVIDFKNKVGGTIPKVTELSDAQKKAAEAARKHAEEIRGLADELSGKNVVRDAQKLIEALRLPGVMESMRGNRQAIDDLLVRVDALIKKGAGGLQPALLGIATAAREARASLNVLIERPGLATEIVSPEGLKALHELPELYKVINRETGLWTRYQDVVNQELENAATTVSEKLVPATLSFGDSVKAGLGNLPDVINRALQGGGNVLKSVGASLGTTLGEALKGTLTKGLSSALGSGIGGALGSILPGLGTALGALAGDFVGKLMETMTATKGKIMGAILGGPIGFLVGGFLGGQAEHKRVNDLRDSFVSAAGGLDKLREQAAEAGLTLDRLLAAKKVKDFEAATEELSAAFQRQADTVKGLEDAIGAMGAAFGEGGIIAITAEDAAAQATIFTTVFNRAVKEKGLVGAADALRESFAGLWESLGSLVPPEVLEAILGPIHRVMEMTKPGGEGDPAGLFRGAAEGAAALAQILTGLSKDDMPLLDSQFQAFGQQAQSAFAQAIAGGATSQEAFMAIGPLLQAIISASEEYGIAIDDNTLALIDQAEQNGVTFKTSPMERMVEVLEAIAVKLGADLPRATRRAEDAFDDFGDEATRAGRSAVRATEDAIDTVEDIGPAARSAESALRAFGTGASTTFGNVEMAAGDAARGISTTWDVNTGYMGASMADLVTDTSTSMDTITSVWSEGAVTMEDRMKVFGHEVGEELMATADFAESVFGYMTKDFDSALGTWGDIADRAADEVNRALENINDVTIGVHIDMPDITSVLGLGSVTPAAHGFSGDVSSPSLFLAGERGREHVEITPAGRSRGGSDPAVLAELREIRRLLRKQPGSIRDAVLIAR